MEENIKAVRKAKIFPILIGFISFLQIKLFGGILSPFEFLAVLFFLWQFTISNKFNINLFKNFGESISKISKQLGAMDHKPLALNEHYVLS